MNETAWMAALSGVQCRTLDTTSFLAIQLEMNAQPRSFERSAWDARANLSGLPPGGLAMYQFLPITSLIQGSSPNPMSWVGFRFVS
jgi:hypothetical protein